MICFEIRCFLTWSYWSLHFRVQPPWRGRGLFPRLRTRYVPIVQLWVHATTRKHQASVLYLWVLGRMAGLFPEVTLAHVSFCFFLVPVNLSLRLVVVFQGMPAWNYLESNIYRSFVLQDPQRSVSCIPESFPSLVLFPYFLSFSFSCFLHWICPGSLCMNDIMSCC